MLRSVFAMAFVTGVSAQCWAEEHTKPAPFSKPSCAVIRFYVAKYSAVAAEEFARNAGATEAQIESGRQCLKVRTAQEVRTAEGN
jgi:hypothetical protein